MNTYQPRLNDHTTQELLDTYRQSPTAAAAAAAELERRGVELWAHGLTHTGEPLDFSALPAVQKIRMITAMGFTPLAGDHQPDCPARVDRGFRCNCVPDATVWCQPADVTEYRHETWNERSVGRVGATTSGIGGA